MYDSQMICFSHCVAVGKQIRRQSGGEDVELRIMHPTKSSSQMVVGTVFFRYVYKAYEGIQTDPNVCNKMAAGLFPVCCKFCWILLFWALKAISVCLLFN